MTVAELAELLSVGSTTVYKMRERGIAPRVTWAGGRMRFRREDVLEWLEDGLEKDRS